MRKAMAACVAGLFALGLAACDESGSRQQSSTTATESSDAAAMSDSPTLEGTTSEATTDKPAE